MRKLLACLALAAAAWSAGCAADALPADEGYLVAEGAAAGPSQGTPVPGPGAPSAAPSSAPADPLPSVSQDAYVEGAAPGGPQDQYLTDPIPAGRPAPVEPGAAKIEDGRTVTASLSISAATILSHMDQFNQDKLSVLPPGGVLLSQQSVSFHRGESVFDVLKRETRNRGIHLEFSWFPIYNSVYVEGMGNLYQFDCGSLSGWMYKVNGWFPNYGASRYAVQPGDRIEWVYTCDLGRDIGGWWPGLELP